MGNIDEALLKRIIALGQSSDAKNLLAAANELCKKNFPAGVKNEDVLINRLRPTIIKMLTSEIPEVQKEGAFFITRIEDETSERNAQAFIDEDNVIPLLLNNLISKDTTVLYQTLLCIGNFAVKYIQAVMEAGVLPSLVEMLEFEDEKVCQEAVFCIFNISGHKITEKQAIIDAGVLPHLRKLLLSSSNSKLVGKALDIFSNIADVNERYKQYLIDAKTVEPVVKLLKDVKVSESAVWAIGTLANRATLDQKQHIVNLGAVPNLVSLISSKKEKLSEYSACAIKDITESKEDIDATEIIQAIIDAKAVPYLIKLLNSPSDKAIDEAMGALLNISSCNDKQCQHVLDSRGMLSYIKNLLKHPNPLFNKRVVQFVENATSYNQTQVNILIEAGIIPLIIKQLESDDIEIKKVAMDVTNNIIKFKPGFISNLVDLDIIPSLCNLLISDDVKLLRNVLSALNEMFKKAENNGDDIREEFKDCDGFEKVENLQIHNEHEIQRQAEILISYLDVKPSSIQDAGAVNKETRRKRGQTRESSSSVSGGPSTRNKRTKISATRANLFSSDSETSASAERDVDNETPWDDDLDIPDPSKSSVVSGPTSSVNLNFPNASNEKMADTTNTANVGEDPSTMVIYFLPSEFFLIKTCDKFGIKYSRNAVNGFWQKIDIEKIKQNSKPNKLYPIKENVLHGFACFSIFLTGAEEKTPIIQKIINKYFFDNPASLGNYKGYDFTQDNNKGLFGELIFSGSMTEFHFELITRWLKCRIGIYENGAWQRFGNWDEKDVEISTLLMEKKDEKYQPILSLKD